MVVAVEVFGMLRVVGGGFRAGHAVGVLLLFVDDLTFQGQRQLADAGGGDHFRLLRG